MYYIYYILHIQNTEYYTSVLVVLASMMYIHTIITFLACSTSYSYDTSTIIVFSSSSLQIHHRCSMKFFYFLLPVFFEELVGFLLFFDSPTMCDGVSSKDFRFFSKFSTVSIFLEIPCCILSYSRLVFFDIIDLASSLSSTL